MIKAKDKDTIIFGLSDENLRRLKEGEPISFNLSELGLPPMNVVIFNGKDEQTMQTMFKDRIHPYLTVIKNSRAKEN